jgi:hypothetical protein
MACAGENPFIGQVDVGQARSVRILLSGEPGATWTLLLFEPVGHVGDPDASAPAPAPSRKGDAPPGSR